MEEAEHVTWRSVLATVLWVIVTVGGLTLMVPLLTIMSGVGVALGSGDPTAQVMDRYRVVSARHFGVFIYGAVWLGGIIWLNTYFTKAKTVKGMFLRFGWVLALEAAVWGLGALTQAILF